MSEIQIHCTRSGCRQIFLFFNSPTHTSYVITHDGPGAAIRLTLEALRAGVAVSYRDVRDALEVA